MQQGNSRGAQRSLLSQVAKPVTWLPGSHVVALLGMSHVPTKPKRKGSPPMHHSLKIQVAFLRLFHLSRLICRLKLCSGPCPDPEAPLAHLQRWFAISFIFADDMSCSVRNPGVVGGRDARSAGPGGHPTLLPVRTQGESLRELVVGQGRELGRIGILAWMMATRQFYVKVGQKKRI